MAGVNSNKPNEPMKFDDKKTKWHLLYFPVFEEVVKVLELGMKKYGYKNYMLKGGLSDERLFDAMMRHMISYMGGEVMDKESDLTHLAHAIANIMMMYEINDQWGIFDDFKNNQ